MAINPNRANKTFRKLRKLTSSLSKRPLPDRVHSLRTGIRRVEAVIHALIPGDEAEKTYLLKSLKPIRQRAGDVRDMDVLIAFAATLSRKGDDSCLVQLIEHLSFERIRYARRLHRAFSARRNKVRRSLKQCSALIQKQSSNQKKNNAKNRELSAAALTTAHSIWAEMSEWPQLNPANLHPFRLKVKELRYILELAEDKNKTFINALGKVKDAIGEWHDWSELTGIAADILEDDAQSPLMKRIRSTTRSKLENALAVSNALRTKYSSGTINRRGRRRSESPPQTGGWQQVHLPRHVLPKRELS